MSSVTSRIVCTKVYSVFDCCSESRATQLAFTLQSNVDRDEMTTHAFKTPMISLVTFVVSMGDYNLRVSFKLKIDTQSVAVDTV